ncbi:beta-N-acetylhexosaminidase [Alistipes sp. kh20]|uniref:beta-N-acetylhexosaminidase n=1 Tax=Alistipes montrealensis TaxID=2834113 RepID=UPI001BCFE501|nr:beta-N-acetylhexosaminidase [Alistipes montrealensis]MBS4767075.1 beta-N-acetylhexosaminidase [Alistipes montrealensis]
MKRIFTLIALCTAFAASASTRQLQVIPQPVKAELRVGVFVTAGCRVECEGFDTRSDRLTALAGQLVTPCDPASSWNGANAIVLRRDPAAGIPAEGYRIDISARRAQLTAGDEAGFFYGLQTLFQMADQRGNLPCASIEDYPRYRYRGLHLDVCRHFFPVKFIKHYLDWMASCKLNTFHWHLTDDQGWRIEIRRYPRLTQIGGYRAQTQIGGFHEDPITYEQGRYGGYYTQDEIREVVAYAAERHITVIPEVEMPGHAMAALAAYPELACGHGPKHFETSGRWGVLDDVFCPGKEQTFEFLEGVLDEVLELFPSKFIHIGGDECPRVRWKECPDCQARLAAEGLKDESGLQTYLTRRIGRYLESKGRRLIGWDEILEGGLAPDAVVMSWRGTKGGIAAARQQHEVIMTPSTYLYFDKKATDSYDEPVSLSSSLLPLEKIYGYDPSEGIAPEDQRYLLGVQANLWTEFIWTEGRVSFQLLPRIYALSEIAWSPVERKSWEEFSEVRLPAHLARIDATGEPYRLPAPLGIENGTSEGESFSFAIRPPFPGCKVCYTLNGAVPQDFDREMPETFDIVVPRGEQRTLRCVTIAPSGRRSTVTTVMLTNQIQTNNPE